MIRSFETSWCSNTILNAYLRFAVCQVRNQTYLLVQIDQLEVVQGVELAGVVVALLLGIEVHQTCIGKESVLLGPLVALEDTVSALPEEANLNHKG